MHHTSSKTKWPNSCLQTSPNLLIILLMVWFIACEKTAKAAANHANSEGFAADKDLQNNEMKDSTLKELESRTNNHLEEKFRQLASELKAQNENKKKTFKNMSDHLNTFKIKSQQENIYTSQLETKLTALLVKDVPSNTPKDNEKSIVMKPQRALSILPTGTTTVSSSIFVTRNPINRNIKMNTIVVCERIKFGIGFFISGNYHDGKASITCTPSPSPREKQQRKIKIHEARYGRFNQKVCPGHKSDFMCAKNVSKTVMGLCGGKPSCSFTVTNEVMGLPDPCPVGHVDKYLEVQYFCV